MEVVEVAVVVEEAPVCRTVRAMAPSVFEGVVVDEGGGYPPMGGSPRVPPPPWEASFIRALPEISEFECYSFASE